jgi:cell division protein FtsI/penicillin-binding protein 2
MAAVIDLGLVSPETICLRCDGPVQIGEYTIKTWNEKYHPGSTMTEILLHSDNVGMVFVAEKLGVKNLLEYLRRFGLGEKTGVDLQGESDSSLREENSWGKIDLATAGFGQGIAVTPIQMVRAMGAIANKGRLVTPQVVKKIKEDGREIFFKFPPLKQIIKPQTARIITQMMVEAVERGEAGRSRPKGYRIAGKTGTAQIPISGHYDEEKTVASFIGFAPADNPRFVMLVSLREPKTSPWGTTTAAPIWFEIAKEIFRIWGIPPS